MSPCVCLVTDHRRRQNVVRTSVTHSAVTSFESYASFVLINLPRASIPSCTLHAYHFLTKSITQRLLKTNFRNHVRLTAD